MAAPGGLQYVWPINSVLIDVAPDIRMFGLVYVLSVLEKRYLMIGGDTPTITNLSPAAVRHKALID